MLDINLVDIDFNLIVNYFNVIRNLSNPFILGEVFQVQRLKLHLDRIQCMLGLINNTWGSYIIFTHSKNHNVTHSKIHSVTILIFR